MAHNAEPETEPRSKNPMPIFPARWASRWSKAGRNRSFCRSPRGFAIAFLRANSPDQKTTIRSTRKCQIASKDVQNSAFRQNRSRAIANSAAHHGAIRIIHR